MSRLNHLRDRASEKGHKKGYPLFIVFSESFIAHITRYNIIYMIQRFLHLLKLFGNQIELFVFIVMMAVRRTS